jgi:hypothetical protein
MLLAGDPVLVAIKTAIRPVEGVAALEVRDRIAATCVVMRANPPDPVRVTRVQRPAVRKPQRLRATAHGNHQRHRGSHRDKAEPAHTPHRPPFLGQIDGQTILAHTLAPGPSDDPNIKGPERLDLEYAVLRLVDELRDLLRDSADLQCQSPCHTRGTEVER